MKGTFSPTFIDNGHSSLHPGNLLSSFDYQPLGRVVFGAGSLARLGEFAAALGQRPLLVTDPGLRHTGHPQRAENILREANLNVVIFDGVKENPTEHHVLDGVEVARSHQADLLVAVGGGSSMDCAKGINFLLTNGGRMSDYKGHGRALKPMLPSIGVPTTAGTGSEAQSYALITDASTHLKMACGDKKAAFRVSILDPDLTLSQPPSVTAVTGIDAVAHAVESMVCRKANPISRSYSTAAFAHLFPYFRRVLESPQDHEARSSMLLGAHFSGMAIEAAMLGACHSCANPLTAHYGLTHGIAIALMLPHVVRFNGPVANAQYAELLRSVHLPVTSNPADTLAHHLAELAAAAQLPTRLRDCNVSETILPLLADEANQQWTARFNPREVGERELLELYRAAW